MEHLLAWTGLLVRWGHVIIGLMWIGASFYLISWENKFNRTRNLREGVEGDFWTIQGGDFYFVEKLKGPPAALPLELHWFKYEAYLTWLSGFVLLCLLYYAHPRTMLVDPTVADLAPGTAVLIGLGSLAGAWLAYDLYCRTPVARDLRRSALIGLLFVAGSAYFFTHVFGARVAFMHVGAVLGTFMSGNVFFGIIPWHRKLVRAIERGEPVDHLYARRPGFRSRHNHYLTFPVLFIMVSGHAPAVLAHPWNWALLTAITLGAGLVKHAHTRLQRRQSWHGYLIAGVLVFALVVVATAPRPAAGGCAEPVSAAEARAIVSLRCTGCHSATPVDEHWTSAPNGITFDTLEQISAHADRILERAVRTRTMPPEGAAAMTEEERTRLGCWITRQAARGAR